MSDNGDLIFILDESWSMVDMGNEPILATNEFIKSIKQDESYSKSTFSMYKFSGLCTTVVDNIPIKYVPEFTEYTPHECTSLFDTIGIAIKNKLDKPNKDNVTCIILTDGEDNNSKSYTVKSISKLMSDVEKKHGWKFIYLAANQDAFTYGGMLGLRQENCTTFSATPEGFRSVMRCTSESIRSNKSKKPTARIHTV